MVLRASNFAPEICTKLSFTRVHEVMLKLPTICDFFVELRYLYSPVRVYATACTHIGPEFKISEVSTFLISEGDMSGSSMQYTSDLFYPVAVPK